MVVVTDDTACTVYKGEFRSTRRERDQAIIDEMN